MSFVRKWRKKSLFILGGCILALFAFFAPTIWGTPWIIEHFYYRVLVEFALQQPVLLSHLGLLEPYGLTFYNDDLADYSVNGREKENEFWQKNIKILGTYPINGINDTVSYDAVRWFIQDKVNGIPFAFHDYPVNSWIFGKQSQIPDDLVQSHRFNDIQGAKDYISRISKIGIALRQLADSVAYRYELGIAPPRFVIEKSIAEMESFIAVPASENMLYQNFSEKTGTLNQLSPRKRSLLLTQLELEIERSVYPGYRTLIEECTSLLPMLTSDDGVWKLPDGNAYYSHLLRSFTTTELSANQIHEIGLDEVERIHGEMRDIFQAQGLPGNDIAESFRVLNDDPQFTYPDTEEGRQQVLDAYQNAVDEIETALDQYFYDLPKTKIITKRVPEFKEKTAALAYMYPAPLDGFSPAVLFVNLRDMTEVKTFVIPSIAYHEALPGHHYQWDINVHDEELPVIRRLLPFMAYIEGWAMYAETLACEMGFARDPYDRLGFLQTDLLRACRLVVDTGLHFKRWTRGEAIEYMQKNSGLTPIDIVSEVERFIVYPGHACSYKVGHLKILELREKAQKRLGNRFDLKDFHRTIMKSGALPLTLLEEVVDQWLDECDASGRRTS